MGIEKIAPVRAAYPGSPQNRSLKLTSPVIVPVLL